MASCRMPTSGLRISSLSPTSGAACATHSQQPAPQRLCACYRKVRRRFLIYDREGWVGTAGEVMTMADSIFQRALSNMLTEIFDGPPGQEAYVLNPGDLGLLRQLETIDAKTAS